MTDRPEIPVETTEGARPRSSGGERILVALAAMALLGAALIAVGKFLPEQDAVSVPTSTPRPTARPTGRPSRTPGPTPAPIELTVTRESPPPAQTPEPYFGGWIRAKQDLTIYGYPSPSGQVIGTLATGDVAYVGAVPESTGITEWMSVDVSASGTTGYVATREGTTELVQTYAPASYPISGSIWSVAAGPSGFLAIGARSGQSTGDFSPALFASSSGSAWHEVRDPPSVGCCFGQVAWGPVGWILTSDPGGNGETWLWNSQDGDHWDSLGVLRSGGAGGIQANEAGYVLTTYGRRAYGQDGMWFSPDGEHWTESGPASSNLEVMATQLGFYGRNDPRNGGRSDTFSADGLTWSTVTGVSNVRAAAAGGVMLGLQTDLQTGTVLALVGTIDGDQLSWRTMGAAGQLFANAVLTTLVSDGTRATAFGIDRLTEAPLAWVSDGASWERAPLPDALAGPAAPAAAGDRGVVVVSHRWNPRGENPIFWHRDRLDRWTPEPNPVVRAVAPPSASDCGPPPRDAVEFVVHDTTAAPYCYGDAPITFRTWSSSCDGCAGTSTGTYREEWLAFPNENTLYLSPVGAAGNWWATAVLSPDLAPSADASWLDAWVKLTGHFDDPAAPSCRWTPPPDQVDWYVYSGTPAFIEACRQQFVVTAVRVAGGP